MKEIRLSEIIIPGLFRHSTPKEEKMSKIRRYVKYFGKVDKPVTLNGNILVDGYIRYLVALEFGIDIVPFIRTLDSKKVHKHKKKTISLITGRFKNNHKGYIWKNNKNLHINIGDRVLVDSFDSMTGADRGVVTVVNVFESKNPKMLKHKSVIRVIK